MAELTRNSWINSAIAWRGALRGRAPRPGAARVARAPPAPRGAIAA